LGICRFFSHLLRPFFAQTISKRRLPGCNKGRRAASGAPAPGMGNLAHELRIDFGAIVIVKTPNATEKVWNEKNRGHH
jgi:hypothetical protein